MTAEPSLDQIRTVADNVQVHKFGGSSLADAFCYRRVARIVTEYAGASDVVVVSAAGDTTNRILAIIKAQKESGDTADILLDQLERFRQGLIYELLGSEFAAPILEQSTVFATSLRVKKLSNTKQNCCLTVNFGHSTPCGLIKKKVLKQTILMHGTS